MQPDSIEQKQADLRAGQNSPQSRNGFKIGQAVRLPCMPTVFEVVGLNDESLIEIRAPSGHVLKAGWRTLIKVKTKELQ